MLEVYTESSKGHAGSELVQGKEWLAGLATDREEEEEESWEDDYGCPHRTVKLTRY